MSTYDPFGSKLFDTILLIRHFEEQGSDEWVRFGELTFRGIIFEMVLQDRYEDNWCDDDETT